MKFTVNEKEYTIKFGYKPTLKSKLISKIAKVENADGDETEKIENLMLLVPELVLVGLQVNHSDEFGYDYNTNEGYEAQLDKAFDLVDTYLNSEGADFSKLYSELENELLNNGFLSSLFQEEQSKAKKSAKKQTTKATEN